MTTVIMLTPNDWVSEEVLIAVSGLSESMIRHARRTSWLEGREYRYVSADMNPKDNCRIMYHRASIDIWVTKQRPAVKRRISPKFCLNDIPVQ